MPRLATIEESFDTIRTLAPWAIALAVFARVLSLLSTGALLQSILVMVGERLSLPRAVAIEIGAATVSLVAAGPLGFGAAIYKWTRKAGVSTEAAMLASWLGSVFDAAALMVFALIGAINLLFFHRLSRATGIATAYRSCWDAQVSFPEGSP